MAEPPGPACSRRRRRGVMAAAALAVVPVLSLLSGCVTIPDHGPVVEERPVGGTLGPVFQVLAEGAAPGAGPGGDGRGVPPARPPSFTDEHRVARTLPRARSGRRPG